MLPSSSLYSTTWRINQSIQCSRYNEPSHLTRAGLLEFYYSSSGEENIEKLKVFLPKIDVNTYWLKKLWISIRILIMWMDRHQRFLTQHAHHHRRHYWYQLMAELIHSSAFVMQAKVGATPVFRRNKET